MTYSETILQPRGGAGRGLARAAFAAFAGAAKAAVPAGQGGDAWGAARSLWPDDPAPRRILARAAVTPLEASDMLAPPPEAQAAAFLAGLAPMSAAAELMAAGLAIALGARETVAIPYRVGNPRPAPWVGEGQPIPAREYDLGGHVLGPVRKVAAIVVASRELMRRTAAEAIFTRLLREDAAAALDAALFNADAAADDRPAGLLNGVAPLPAATGGGTAAMEADLAELAGAVTEGGGRAVAFVAHPRQAAAILVRKPELAVPVWPSPALAPGSVVALAPDGFAFAVGGEPDIEATSQGNVHMADPAAELVGADGTAAAPLRSLFQTGMVGTVVLLDVAFAMRAPGLVARKEGVTW